MIINKNNSLVVLRWTSFFLYFLVFYLTHVCLKTFCNQNHSNNRIQLREKTCMGFFGCPILFTILPHRLIRPDPCSPLSVIIPTYQTRNNVESGGPEPILPSNWFSRESLKSTGNRWPVAQFVRSTNIVSHPESPVIPMLQTPVRRMLTMAGLESVISLVPHSEY